MPELPSFSVEKPESATVLPVELPSGLFRNLRRRGMEPVFGFDTFQDEGMSSDRSLSCSSRLFVACKINHEMKFRRCIFIKSLYQSKCGPPPLILRGWMSNSKI